MPASFRLDGIALCAARLELALLQRGAIVLATAAGFGRPRPDRRGEALGFNFYEFDPRSISVVTWSWSGGTFAEVGRRTFQRGQRGGVNYA